MKYKKADKTIISEDGNILFFGLQHFLDDIAKGDCCFICGAQPNSKKFNDEHIIPDWILKRFNLHANTITLPNETEIKYGQYKVPCCEDCNSELGNKYEKPISRLLSNTYTDIVNKLKTDKELLQLLFKWMTLIFLKTHLKDKQLLLNRDTRKKTGFIGDYHYWEDIHHIHCIARSHHTGAIIEGEVFGSFFIFPLAKSIRSEKFDYIDNSFSKTLMLQIEELCIIVVLNDAGAGADVLKDKLNKISGALNEFQIREIISHLIFINLSLKEKPVFNSSFSFDGTYKIIADVPKTWFILEKSKRITSHGKHLRYYVESLIDEGDLEESILEEIEQGKRSYLFDENGEFKKN